MTTSQGSTVHADTDVWGRCNICRGIVIYGDRYTHPCERYYVDTTWEGINNPDNTPWMPGYRFWMSQHSGAATKRRPQAWRMTPRTYKVQFKVDRDGELVHTGGPKPSEALWASARAAYAQGRPGSNWYPGCEDEPPSCGPGLEGL